MIPTDTVVPEKLATDMFLAIFKEIYLILRRILIGYAMPALRREWAAFHPFLLPNGSLEVLRGELLSDKQLSSESTTLFDRIFGLAANGASQMLGSLAFYCSPARRRVADDVVLLDALLWNLVLDPRAMPLFFQRRNLNPVQAQDLQEYLMLASFSLHAVFASHAKTYKQYVQAQVNAGEPSAFASVECCFVAAHKHFAPPDFIPFPDFDGPQTPFSKLLSVVTFVKSAFSLYVSGRVDPSVSTEHAEVLKNIFKMMRRSDKDTIRVAWATEDACDYCGSSVEETKLMRCSKCLYARYCSGECQREAWNKGRKYRNGGRKFVTDPHKLVCFDAKMDDVSELMKGK